MKHLIPLLLALLFSSNAHADITTFDERQRFGRGAIQDAEWNPAGDSYLVDTVIGAWIYPDGILIEDLRLGTYQPAGTWIAGVDKQNNLTLYDSTSLQSTASLPAHTIHVIDLVWSPDGAHLASLDQSGKLILWDMNSQTIIQQLQAPNADHLDWSRGGSYIAALDSEGATVWVWDISGEMVFTHTPEYIGSGATIDWRSDTQLALSISSEGTIVTLWDVTTAKLVVQPGVGSTSDLAYSPDGSTLAVSSIVGVHLQDAVSSEINWMHSDFQGWKLAWSPGGERLVASNWLFEPGKHTVWVIEAATGEKLQTFNDDYAVKFIRWNSDGSQILIVNLAEQIFVFDTSLTRQYQSYPRELNWEHARIGNLPAWNTASTMIATADTLGGFKAWNVADGTEIIQYGGHEQQITEMEWQPGGDLLATYTGDFWSSVDTNAKVWQITTTPTAVTTIAHASNISGVAWSPSGDYLATLDSHRFLHLWNPDQSQIIRQLDLWEGNSAFAHEGSVAFFGIEWSPTADFLLTPYFSSGMGHSCDFGRALVWNVETGEIPETITLYPAQVWTSDNRLLWADWSICPYEEQPEHPRIRLGVSYDGSKFIQSTPIELTGLSQPIVSATFSPDAHFLAGFDESGSGIVWNIETQQKHLLLENATQAIWSPDSQMLALYGMDNTIRIIDSTEGTVLDTFNAHYGDQIQWSPDSRKIAQFGEGTMFIWENIRTNS